MSSCFRLVVSAAALSASTLLAFNPPADAQHGVTLCLAGVPQSVGTAQPLTFAVQRSNASASNATGTVALQLTDDWQLDAPSAFAVSVAPQQTWQTACVAHASSRVLFARFSVAKTWQSAEFDLSAYAGRPITLRLWIGPGPKRDTTCDNGFWGDPLLLIGPTPAPAGEAEWAARLADASARAADAAAHKPRAPGAFALDVRGERFGAAVVLGREGLLDAALAFSDGRAPGLRGRLGRGAAADLRRRGRA